MLTPIIWWATNCEDKIAQLKFLVSNRADVLWYDIDGKTASDHAKEADNFEAHEFLVKCENLQTKFNERIIHISELKEHELKNKEIKSIYSWITEKISNGIYVSPAIAEKLVKVATIYEDYETIKTLNNFINKNDDAKRYANRKFAQTRMSKIRGRESD